MYDMQLVASCAGLVVPASLAGAMSLVQHANALTGRAGDLVARPVPSLKPEFARLNLILVDYQIGGIMVAPAMAGAKGFPMKAIVAICVAFTALWLADIELNDGRYGDVTGRTIMSLISK